MKPITNMGKFLILVLGLAMGSMGCQAFNDHPEEQQKLMESLGMPFPGEPASSGSGALCAPVDGITIARMSNGITDSSGFASNAEGSASKVSDGIVDIKLVSKEVEGATLTISLSQNKDKFDTCKVEYRDDVSSYSVVAGSIMVDQFSDIGENRGTFVFEFAPEPAAASIQSALIVGKVTNDELSVTTDLDTLLNKDASGIIQLSNDHLLIYGAYSVLIK